MLILTLVSLEWKLCSADKNLRSFCMGRSSPYPRMSSPDFLNVGGRVKFSESEQLLLLILTPLAGCGAHAKGVLGRGWPTGHSYPWGQRGKQGHARRMTARTMS